jgi:NAD+ dependent glucose-6-phosphate dehydrogenase/L-arabinose 1-dehydrogenase [NAD(P)+]
MPVPQRVLITGATGNIGNKLREYLLATGRYELRLLCLNPNRVENVVSADLRVYNEAWVNLFEGVDVVVHLANAASSHTRWEEANTDNIGMLINVYNASAAHGVRRVVFASSVWAMYGYRFRTGQLRPDTPADPGISPYGITKILAERAARAFFECLGVRTTVLRIGACLPGGDAPGAYMATGDWNQDCWISNRDMCQGFEKAILAEQISFAILNLTSNNSAARWSLTETEEAIGYKAQDSYTTHVGMRRRLQAIAGRIFYFTIPAFAKKVVPSFW